jgi:AhpD family alkylhydroperoxidase
MTTVEVFDPAMCCSTGVCGPSVDPALATFAADLAWLARQGVPVERHNLSQEPGAFAERDLVRQLLVEHGEKALPAVVVDGELRSSGRYPTQAELAAWALGNGTPDGLDPATAELVAIGAAVAANCEPCLKFHYNEARQLGVGAGAMAAAVRVGQAVKDAPARSVLELAAKLLGTGTASLSAAGSCVMGQAGTVTGSGPGRGPGDMEAEVVGAECSDGASSLETTSSGCCAGAASATEVALIPTPSATSGCCG